MNEMINIICPFSHALIFILTNFVATADFSFNECWYAYFFLSLSLSLCVCLYGLSGWRKTKWGNDILRIVHIKLVLFLSFFTLRRLNLRKILKIKVRYNGTVSRRQQIEHLSFSLTFVFSLLQIDIEQKSL